MIESLFTGGNIALLILLVMAIEAVVLMALIKRMPAVLFGILAGAALVLALRAALLQQGNLVIAVFLALSLLFHMAEVRQWLRLAKR
jgi:hypothetical protein